MALKLFLALFATAGYALLVNVPRRHIDQQRSAGC